jgi:hypothetical protein
MHMSRRGMWVLGGVNAVASSWTWSIGYRYVAQEEHADHQCQRPWESVNHLHSDDALDVLPLPVWVFSSAFSIHVVTLKLTHLH